MQDHEELQSPLVLIKPAHWIALCGFIAIFLAAFSAAFWVSIPIKVAGEGLFFNPSKIFSITAAESGVVNRINVKWGTRIKRGDLVLEMAPSRSVTAKQEGVAFSIDVQNGDRVSIGQPLIWFQQEEGENLQMAGLVPYPSWQQVKVGMPVEMAVLSANRKEYGRAKGAVSALIPFWTKQAQDFFPTQHLPIPSGPDQLSYLIVVDLLFDSKEPSGIKWTSGNGPPFPIQLGTPCHFTIIIEEKKLISYLFR